MSTFVTNDGVTLSYTDVGTGKPVVLIPGYAAPASSWILTSDALVAAGYRAISFDRRSAGESETAMFGQRIARHGADIAGLLAALDLDDVTLAGGSMGASCIWSYVDLFGTGRIRSIVTVDQTPKMVNSADWQHGFYGLTEQNLGTFFENGIPRPNRGQAPEGSLPGLLRIVERLGAPPVSRDGRAPETVKLLQDHAEQDWRDVIERIDVPFLMVAGRNSQLWPWQHAEASVASNPLGRLEVLEAGHATNLDQPDEFNAALLGFLASV